MAAVAVDAGPGVDAGLSTGAVHRDGFPRAGALADATAHTGVGADLWGLGEHPFAQLAGGPGQGPQKLHQVALDAAGEAVVVHPQGLQRLAQQLHLLNVAGPQAPALRGQQNRIGGQRQYSIVTSFFYSTLRYFT